MNKPAIFLLIGLILIGCQNRPNDPATTKPQKTATQSTSSPIVPTATKTATYSPSPTLEMSTQTLTPTEVPATQYQLTYVSNQHYGHVGVYAIDVGCLDEETPCFSDPHLLFEWRSYPDDSPQLWMFDRDWSPDGMRVVIDTTNGIIVCDWDGANLARFFEGGKYLWRPQWLPETGEIIFETKLQTDEIIYMIMNSDGSNLREMTEFNTAITAVRESGKLSNANGFKISNNGESFVFNGIPLSEDLWTYYDQIYISKNDGSNIKQLTNHKSHNFAPSFSPDDKKVIFYREYEPENPFDNSLFTLVILSLDDMSEQLLFDPIDTNYFGDFAWAPFGDWIAYTREDNIFFIKADGSKTIQVTDSRFIEESLAWRVVRKP